MQERIDYYGLVSHCSGVHGIGCGIAAAAASEKYKVQMYLFVFYALHRFIVQVRKPIQTYFYQMFCFICFVT